MRIIIGTPIATSLELEIETTDIGAPEKQMTRDGRLVEVPNTLYVHMIHEVGKGDR